MTGLGDNEHGERIGNENDQDPPSAALEALAPLPTSQDEFDEAFVEARARLQAWPLDDAMAAFPFTFSESTFRRLHGTSYEKFNVTTKALLIKLFMERHDSLYDQIADLIVQRAGDQTAILEKYHGEYRYYRFAARTGSAAPLDYVEGKILIENDGQGNPRFHHWSHDYEEEKPEHVGYVFRFGERVFFLGSREGVLRLAITQTIMSKEKDEMHGVVVSVRNEYRDPFAARFIMVSVENTKSIEMLSDKTAVDSDSSSAKTAGELNFHKKSKGKNVYYMLTH